ncbi:hypothetical protein RN001_003343 [Aquatica leii]|uniref:Uncharacterized protein n=1 Tax=Aquatica leii TaxID=1421715 RepID=A0AAN7SKP9_9COLE|nr:hypothetical protein RN001_003343 [Aquatica leii]
MAPIVYEVNRLSAEELVYELVIRGISELDTVDAMRKTLRSLLRLEREGQSLDYPAYPFKVAEDIKELNDKVSEMQALLHDFDGSNQNTHKKLLSKYAYALGRANRVVPDNESDKLQKSKVLVAILNFKSDLDKKVRSYEKSLSNKTKGVLDLDMLNINTSSDSESSVVDEPLGKPNFESTRVHVPVTPKPIPVSQWNLKFSAIIALLVEDEHVNIQIINNIALDLAEPLNIIGNEVRERIAVPRNLNYYEETIPQYLGDLFVEHFRTSRECFEELIDVIRNNQRLQNFVIPLQKKGKLSNGVKSNNAIEQLEEETKIPDTLNEEQVTHNITRDNVFTKVDERLTYSSKEKVTTYNNNCKNTENSEASSHEEV